MRDDMPGSGGGRRGDASTSEGLLERARTLLPRAHAAYSNFRVAALLEDEGGDAHPGVNVESVSFGLTICAERNALFGALARGAKGFRRLAVTSEPRGACVPCGACRQVLLEHAPDLMLILETSGGAPEVVPLRALLPRPFLSF